ncbi:MFS transporter [soil metagenome]
MGEKPYLAGRVAVRVFLCFAAAYVLSYAFRSVNAVIAPALIEDLHLSNADLGLLTSAYFLSFACLQLPLGIWLDKYGPRKTETALLILAAIGAAIFAVSTSLTGLWIGRALIGAGVSACLMASFKAYRMWFAPERQSQLASWMLVAGSSGALLATTPVTAVMPLIGWRGVFWVMAGLIMLAAAAIFFLMKDVETERDAVDLLFREADNAGARAASGQGYGTIFRNPDFRGMALLGLINHGSFLALQTLWAGPWMVTVLKMSSAESAQILFVFNLCLMLGFVLFGWWAPRKVTIDGARGWSTAQAVTVGLFGTLLLQAAILTTTAAWSWLLWIPLAIFMTVTTLVQSHVSLSFPTALAGRASTAYNLLLFIGAFSVQWGIGLLIDAFKLRGASPILAMQSAFALCLALQSAGLIAFVLHRIQTARSTT